MIKWIIVLLFFTDNVPTQTRVLLLDPDQVVTDTDCRRELTKVQDKIKEANVDIWSQCVEVTRSPRKPARHMRDTSQEPVK